MATDPLTTPARVRHRLGYADIELTDQILEEYIEDAQAYIEEETRRTYIDGRDPEFPLARSVCTDLATIYAIIRPAGGTARGVDYKIDEFSVQTSPQLKANLSTANQFQISARAGLSALNREQADLPFSSDQVGL